MKKVADDLKEQGLYVLINEDTGQVWEVNWSFGHLNALVRRENNFGPEWKVIHVFPKEPA